MQVYYTLRLLIKQILKENMQIYLIPYYYAFLCHSMKIYKTLDLVLKTQHDQYTINLNQRIRQKAKIKIFI